MIFWQPADGRRVQSGWCFTQPPQLSAQSASLRSDTRPRNCGSPLQSPFPCSYLRRFG
jgi:hypothetical protein